VMLRLVHLLVWYYDEQRQSVTPQRVYATAKATAKVKRPLNPKEVNL
jgi:hypothetical protein